MPIEHDDAVRRFADACRLGAVTELQAALHSDAVAVCDSDGQVPVPGVVYGAEDVAQLVVVLLCGRPGTELTIEAVNGRAGLALRRAGQAVVVVGVRTIGAGIVILWIVLNPAKLRGWHRA
ncbi:RNA polymerase sigma-70 factor (ECF subfamily) [Kibdelosporangium banguiense]|uniref:RNA polymerase sigma-70 factor (ECF subfamily) n=1 Tax=Kibdelosporangium banguiense TaxID=1365924 RepID=A0ABS4TKK8_9PSEU|nr:hypothetical protein [Kibdelosporangium banguiense]MBP2324961.1 RNA polymerase sigma-70 factor (ECF subfamily) [Kibdelosporangium banguiense]